MADQHPVDNEAYATQRAWSAETRVAPGAIRVRVHPALQFFLPRRIRNNGEIDLAHDPTATAGHVVQSAGVPLTEVGGLVVFRDLVRLATDGVPVSWRSRLQERDRLDVDVGTRPQPLDGPAQFLCDVHLGTLTRRLRLLGVDTAYDGRADDDQLVERAGHQDRVLLSRDRGLLMRRALRRAAFVRGQDPDGQLADLIDRFRPSLRPWTLCLACGGLLSPVSRALVADQLEAGTLLTQEQFSRCQSCGHVYWHGAHDARLKQVVRQHT